tara:strand:+ start:751 stop:1509 length:759 start_codon:yes stop_codon:yes gene_type:complete
LKQNKSSSLKIIILAAGKGKRMNSDIPKVLHKINGVSMINRVIDTSLLLKPEKIIVVTGHKHRMVEEATKKYFLNGIQLEFESQNKQKGTAHAVMQCMNHLEKFDGNVLVLCGDVPNITEHTLGSLISTHANDDNEASLLSALIKDPSGYGRIIRKNNQIVEIVEHKDASEDQKLIKEINSGIYIFKSRALVRTLPLIKNSNSQGEYYLPDAIKLILEDKNCKVGVAITKNIMEIVGINTVQQLKELNEVYN